MPTTSIPTRNDAPPVPAYLATPVPTSDRSGPWPGVVVVHDAFGITDDMRQQADWLAAAGYVTVVPDLYARGGMLRCVKTTFAQLAAQSGPAFDELAAARTWLAASPSCTGVIGVIGFCMGGGFALMLAARPGYSAASVNYGPPPKDVDRLLAGACPVVASFGGRDRSLPGAAGKVERALASAGVPHDVKEYPDARHGFLNRLTAVSPATAVLKVLGVGYDHAAAADAQDRILRFFDVHLRQAPAPDA